MKKDREELLAKYTEDVMNLLEKWGQEKVPAEEAILAGLIAFGELAVHHAPDKYELIKMVLAAINGVQGMSNSRGKEDKKD